MDSRQTGTHIHTKTHTHMEKAYVLEQAAVWMMLHRHAQFVMQ